MSLSDPPFCCQTFDGRLEQIRGEYCKEIRQLQAFWVSCAAVPQSTEFSQLRGEVWSISAFVGQNENDHRVATPLSCQGRLDEISNKALRESFPLTSANSTAMLRKYLLGLIE